MKKILLVLLSFAAFTANAQTVLNVGDIAITAYDTPSDGFSFVTLVDIDSGTEIYFTDEEADNDFTISLNEGHILYTASTAVTAGTVISYNDNGSDFSVASASFAPGNAGDGLIAYQGPSVGQVDRYLFAVGEDSGDIGTIPGGFTAIVLFGNDDGEYSGTRMDNKSNLFTAISNVSNWTTNGSGITPLDLTTFVVSTGGNPAPTISAIIQSPDQTVLSTDTVDVIATITDSDGIASVILQYGFSSGVLTETPITMSNSGNDYSATIPAQSDGTTVYYQIVATDSNAMPAAATTAEFSYTVMDPIPAPTLIITEVADPSDNANARFVEIYNNGTTAIDFSTTQVFLARFANSNTTSQNEQLAGVLNPGSYYVIAGNGTNFTNAYGFAPDAISGAVSGNGDDTYALYAGTPGSGTLFDIYGEIGTDGSGEAWEYEDSRAVRNTTFDVPSDTWVAVNWSISQADVADMTPGNPEPVNYVYENGTWSPSDPVGNSFVTDDIFINNGSIAITGSLSARNVTIALGASLNLGMNTLSITKNIVNDGVLIGGDATISFIGNSEQVIAGNEFDLENILVDNTNGIDLQALLNLEGILTLNTGDFTTNENITFKSSNGKTAVVGPVVNGDLVGNVTIEQFYPAQRAFRFVSSSVDMAGTIFDNWQQGGLNPGDAGYEAGEGTHITGGTSGGFDTTITNNPSIFGFSNDDAQAWTTLSATNDPVASLQAGEPYRLFIRGDRSIDMTIVDTPNDTKLVTKGTLRLTDATQTFDSSLSTGEFVFVGNPYQSKVSIQAMMDDTDLMNPGTEDINPNFMYVWNPQAGTRGAYRAYDFATSSSTPTDTEVTGNLQPGQSMFLQIADDADMDAPSVTFKESFKVTGSNVTATYSLPQATLSLDLFNTGSIALDGFKVNFDSNANDAIDGFDLIKLDNLDESISILNGSDKLVIENRLLPSDGTIIPMNISNMKTGQYDFVVALSGLNSLNSYLYDAFTGQYHLINNNSQTTVSLSFDDSMTSSIAGDRLSIIFSQTTLSNETELFENNISIYPNPSNSGHVRIEGLEANLPTTVELRNLSGQLLLRRYYDSNARDVILTGLDKLNMGVYLLRVQQVEKVSVEKIILN